jgi:flap endonuclease-1
VAVLIGTDFNKGIRGLGPKTALKAVKNGKFEKYAAEIPRARSVMNLFLKPAVTSNYSLKWKPIDVRAIKEILCSRHDFSEKRINTVLNRLVKSKGKQQQSNLDKF